MAVSEDKKRLTISLSKSIFEKLERLSKEKGLTKSSLIAVLIDSVK